MRRSLTATNAPTDRRTFLRATAAAVVSMSCSLSKSREREAGGVIATDELASLANATAWINSPSLTAEKLRGKVVLVQFGTFTCVNWLRTLPYTRAWAAKYRDSGLVVIGVNTPEFSFEHDADNVRQAMRAMHVTYPLAVDNDYAIWRGFSNEYWPALYLIDETGRIRHHQFGEGEYAESERAIQQALTEAGSDRIDNTLVSVDAPGIEAPADWANAKSPETYVGYAKAETFASPEGFTADHSHVYTAPRTLSLNHWALEGDWTARKEPIALNQAGGRITMVFHARDLNLVMGPPKGGRPVHFRVSLDGQPPGSSHGTEVDEHGLGVAGEQRAYQLIRQPSPIVDREFQIEFLDPGVEAFVFTFG